MDTEKFKELFCPLLCQAGMGRVVFNFEKLSWDIQNKCFLGVYLVCESVVTAVGSSEVQNLDGLFLRVSPVLPEP